MKSRSQTDRRSLLTAFLLPAAVFCLLLALNRITPFGGKTLLMSDLNSQYVDFLAEYQRVLKGQGGWFFSWQMGMGMNFPALIAYYLASPFNLLLVFFPNDALPPAVSILTMLKIGCAGLTFALYLKERFGTSGLKTAVFGLFYALCGYSAAYSFNIMWLDAVLLLPLLCLFTERLLRNGNWLCLAVCFFVSFVSQFYMSWMTGIFCALYFLLRLITEYREGWLRSCIRFALAVGTAAGMSAALLLPTYLVLKNNMGLMGQEVPAWTTQFPLFRLLLKAYPGTFDGMKDCLPHIACGLPALIGAVAFFLDKRVRRAERLGSLAILLLLIVSFWLHPLDFFWHAFDHPSWFPYRYAFLFAFWLLVCAWQGLDETKKLPFICIGLGILLPLVGGTGVVLWADLALLAAYGILSVGKQRRDLLVALVCLTEVIFSCQAVFNDYREKYTTVEEYSELRDKYSGQIEELRPDGDSFYRIEKTEFRTYNDPLGMGFPGISHFSSTASTRQAEFLKRLGFDCYATWCEYRGATDFSDALLDIRYVLSPDPETEPVPNELTFPLFFFAPEAFARYDFFKSGVNSVERQDDMLRLLSGEDEPFFTAAAVTRETPLQYSVGAEADHLLIPGVSLNYNIDLNGKQIFHQYRSYTPYIVDLRDIDEAQIDIDTGLKDAFTSRVLAYSFDWERFASLSRRINREAPEIHRTGNSSFTLKLQPADEERLLVSSISFDSGWRIKADGKRISPRMIYDSLLGVKVPAGCETLEITYIPYGQEEGFWISCAALLFFAGACIFIHRKGKRA